MLNFDCLEKGLRIVSQPYFVYDFSRKTFLYFIDLPHFIDWLPLLVGILGNMYVAIVCLTGCDVISFEINLIFLIKPCFPVWPNIQDKNLNILRTKKALKVK